MKPEEQLLCALLRFELDPSSSLSEDVKTQLQQLSDCKWKALHLLSSRQAVGSLLADSFYRIPGFRLPDPYPAVFQNAVTVSSMRFYQASYLFQIIDGLFRPAGIQYFLLKGLSLSALYPQEELRKTGDMDLYIPDLKQFGAACRIAEDHGFQPAKSMSDHHSNFYYPINGVNYEVELHCKPIARFHKNMVDQTLEDYFRNLPYAAYYEHSLSLDIPTLQPTANAFYLLLHMLQHFLDSGFSIRLLCDWTVFLKKHASLIHTETFLHNLKMVHIEHFAYLATGSCIRFLGLKQTECPWIKGHMPDRTLTEQFLQDLFEGGEFGRFGNSRIVMTTERPSVPTYLHEIHKSMKKRYQRAGKFPLLWPFLWIATLFWYFYNNRAVRNTTTRDILKTSGKRYQMFQYLNLFKASSNQKHAEKHQDNSRCSNQQ